MRLFGPVEWSYLTKMALIDKVDETPWAEVERVLTEEECDTWADYIDSVYDRHGRLLSSVDSEILEPSLLRMKIKLCRPTGRGPVRRCYWVERRVSSFGAYRPAKRHWVWAEFRCPRTDGPLFVLGYTPPAGRSGVDRALRAIRRTNRHAEKNIYDGLVLGTIPVSQAMTLEHLRQRSARILARSFPASATSELRLIR